MLVFEPPLVVVVVAVVFLLPTLACRLNTTPLVDVDDDVGRLAGWDETGEMAVLFINS